MPKSAVLTLCQVLLWRLSCQLFSYKDAFEALKKEQQQSKVNSTIIAYFYDTMPWEEFDMRVLMIYSDNNNGGYDDDDDVDDDVDDDDDDDDDVDADHDHGDGDDDDVIDNNICRGHRHH